MAFIVDWCKFMNTVLVIDEVNRIKIIPNNTRCQKETNSTVVNHLFQFLKLGKHGY